MDLSKYGGAYNGALVDSAVQEYNLKSGRLVRSWDALDHIPLSQSQATLPTNGFPWDAYHVNSIDISQKGKFLVSMRNTWSAYLVDIQSGRIDWTLGGRELELQAGTGRPLRVAARRQAAAGRAGEPVRRPLLPADRRRHLRQRDRPLAGADPERRPAGAVRRPSPPQYGQKEGFETDYMGATRQQPDGNVFVGWGSSPYFSEFNRSGKVLLEGELPGPDLGYRATLEPWEGEPLTLPAGAARPTGSHTTVYASWNGATQLASWRVLAGAPGQLSKVAERSALRLRDRHPRHRELPRLPAAGARRGGQGARHLAHLRALGLNARRSVRPAGEL